MLHEFGKTLKTYHLADNEVQNDSSSSPPSQQLPEESVTRTVSLTPFLAETDLEEESVLNGKIKVFKQLISLCLFRTLRTHHGCIGDCA